MSKFTIKVDSFKEFNNPFSKDYRIVNLLVNVKDIPKGISTEVNPRKQNMRTSVARKIIEGLLEEKEIFHFLNRGLVILADDIQFIPSKAEVIISLDDHDTGIIDGGHTYKAIIDNRGRLKEDENQYVKVEVITGVKEFFEKLAAARNTSVQVTDSTIAELENKYDFIKNKILKYSYFNKITFKQNEPNDIDVIDILKIMYMFNLKEFPNHSLPAHKAYVSSIAIFNNFKIESELDDNEYKNIVEILPDLIELYDLIEEDIGKKYKAGTGNGKYGSVKGVDGKEDHLKHTSKFFDTPIDYRSPLGFLYPIFASFRVLLDRDINGKYSWKVNPKDAWNKNGSELIMDTVARSASLGANPQATGKDSGLWKQNLLKNYVTALESRI